MPAHRQGARQRRVLPCCRVSSVPVPITLCCLQKGGAEEGKGDFFLVSPQEGFSNPINSLLTSEQLKQINLFANPL